MQKYSKIIILVISVFVILTVVFTFSFHIITNTFNDKNADNPQETDDTAGLQGINDFDKNDPNTWYEEQSHYIDDEKIQGITVGMTFDEIVKIIGKPQRDTGSGVWIMEWDMSSDKIFTVCFNRALNDNVLESSTPSYELNLISYYIEIIDNSSPTEIDDTTGIVETKKSEEQLLNENLDNIKTGMSYDAVTNSLKSNQTLIKHRYYIFYKDANDKNVVIKFNEESNAEEIRRFDPIERDISSREKIRKEMSAFEVTELVGIPSRSVTFGLSSLDYECPDGSFFRIIWNMDMQVVDVAEIS